MLNTVQNFQPPEPAKFPAYSQLDGIFVLHKPAGPSSAQCLKIFKRLGQKKVGHAGTLDPMASGILIVLLGQATKISGYLLDGGIKTYNGMCKLGVTTATWDAMGPIEAEKEIGSINAETIKSEILAWKKLDEQPVPAYSAAKSDGQPLYKLARMGKVVPQKVKKIKISQAELLEFSLPYVRFRVSCSSGSYIRSLAHSLGVRLGCGAALWELTREYSHPFCLADACSLNDLQKDPGLLAKSLRGIEAALPEMPVIELTAEEAANVRNGKSVPAHGDDHREGQTGILRESGTVIALGRYDGRNGHPCWTIARGLWNQPNKENGCGNGC